MIQSQPSVPDNSGNYTKLYRKSEKVEAIQRKMNIVFERYGIVKSESKQQKLANIFNIIHHVVLNSRYEERLLAEKQEFAESCTLPIKDKQTIMEINDIYNCLVLKKSVCTSDAYATSFMLRHVGIESYHVTIKDKESEQLHEVVQLVYDGEKYYTDPTVLREIFYHSKKQYIEPDIIMLKEEDFFKKFCTEEKEVLYIYPPIWLTESETGTDMEIDFDLQEERV